ncbi:uncharacterized protein LOC115949877 [Quercus lobata]|uniref:uncharacterized protein LOC115949877 n=1 Tax=Quercus lobata TaxID=97700 RepID=UPI0012476C17|nr:uncharacterized protein LOC115949877 [Quercus lobata]
MRKPELKKGMKFPNSKVFREALREYAIKKPVDIKFKLNEKKKLSEFDKNPNWKVAGVQNHVKQALEIDISYSQVYRAKKKATDLITGDEQLQYRKLRNYAKIIRLNDKGSRVILQTKMEDENAQPKFKRMYIRYNAQKLEFLGGCRPIIGLDGCHLKWRFGGQILSAITRDANDNIFPVAFAVVKQENKDSWVWFLQQYSDDIRNPEQLNLIFITDRQKRCVGATTIREFERRMQEMKDLDVKTWEYLVDINPAQWSKSHFSSRVLCDYLANNLSESFNAMILEARDKPILAMLEWIRVRLMTKQYKKMKGIAKYIGKCYSSRQLHDEVDNDRERHVVDLAKKARSYRIWDLTGLPCKHGISAIVKNLEKVEDYMHPCYLKETFAETYKEIIQPMSGQSEWVETNQPAPVAPHVYKLLGRPPKQRKRDPKEPRNPYRVSRMNKTIKCGKCKKKGHNARGCKAGITSETSWQRRDRLAKSAAPSAYVCTSGVPSQGSGGGAARGFKGRKFQPVGGNGKNGAGKGTKSSK